MHLGQEEIEIGQLIQVARCNPSPPLVPLVENRQLGPQEGGLQFVEARIITLHIVAIFDVRSVIPKFPDGRR